MSGMNFSVLLVTFLWNLSLTWSLPDVAETEVSCAFMERCILPCSFQVAPQVIIHWNYLGLCVHSYYDNQDQLEHQHRRYRDRTSLFKEQISRGNASLQLTGVKVQDEGRYQCCTGTTNENDYSFINLKVNVHKVNIQQVENRITCSSEGIYPQPELTWSTTPPSNIKLHSTSTVQQTEEQLYNISSSLILSHTSTICFLKLQMIDDILTVNVIFTTYQKVVQTKMKHLIVQGSVMFVLTKMLTSATIIHKYDAV
uniref:Ig-like domain-containing protein n=1 Tax=Stegastes partitus TaxID=144197 RepID=A0A3B5BKN3_9TELE